MRLPVSRYCSPHWGRRIAWVSVGLALFPRWLAPLHELEIPGNPCLALVSHDCVNVAGMLPLIEAGGGEHEPSRECTLCLLIAHAPNAVERPRLFPRVQAASNAIALHRTETAPRHELTGLGGPRAPPR
jgi:hypothetical protein